MKDYEAKWPKATEKIEKDREELLAFYAFPTEHWVHLKTTNPIEFTFATVRAAASPQAGLENMFTVRRLVVSGTLAKMLTTTNCIESMISIARRTTGRVTRWKDDSMKKRWIAAGMLEAERSFRRVRGHNDMKTLVEALRHEIRTEVDTPTKYDQAAA